MMMAFDYVISPSAPNSSDHSTYYEGIHMWSGIIYGRVQTCFVLTRNISWLIFISSIFRRFYFPCISEALEMKNMIKWRRAHIPLVFIYTTATMFSTVDIVYSCSKSEHSVEFSSLFRGFGFHAWKMVLERKVMQSQVQLKYWLCIKYMRFKHAVCDHSYHAHYNGLCTALCSSYYQFKNHQFSGHLVSIHVTMMILESDGASRVKFYTVSRREIEAFREMMMMMV